MEAIYSVDADWYADKVKPIEDANVITSHRPHQQSHINPMPLIALGVVIIVVFGVFAIDPMINGISKIEPGVEPALKFVHPAVPANAFPAYRQSERTLVEYQYAGAYSHIGDCGFDRYGLPESGAAGYCYVEPPLNPTPDLPHGKPAKEKNTQTQSSDQPAGSAPGSTDVNDDQPTSENNAPPEVPPEVPSQPPREAPKHCNKGGGNGAEGCDPGNHPEKGHDDEH